MTDRPSIVDAVSAFFVAFVGIYVYNRLPSLFASYGLFFSEKTHYMVNIGFQLIFFAFPVMLYYQKNTALLPAMRLRKLDPVCGALIGVAAIIGVPALNWISIFWMQLLTAMGLAVDTGASLTPHAIDQLLWLLAVSAITPALCEELLFRGLLLPSLESLGQKRAIWISGVMFALLHGRLEALPAHLVLGAMLASLVLATGSITAPMLYHGVYNAAILILAFVGARLSPAEQTAIPTVAESIQAIPSAILLIMLWGGMLHLAIRRSQSMQQNPLPTAERKPITRLELGMLSASALLLVAVELSALIGMLPAS